MKSALLIVSLGLIAAFFLLPAYSGAGEEDPSISLGDFYYECARAFRIQLPEGWDRPKAWMLLRATGLEVDGDVDLSQPLRQKHVVEIGSQLGIPLKAEDPEKLFSRKQVEAFLTRFQEFFRLPLKRRSPESRESPPAGDESPQPESDQPADQD